MDHYLKKKIVHTIETRLNIPLDTPLGKLPDAKYRVLFYGADGAKGTAYPGLLNMLHTSAAPDGGNAWSQYLSQFYTETPCAACGGTQAQSPGAVS